MKKKLCIEQLTATEDKQKDVPWFMSTCCSMGLMGCNTSYPGLLSRDQDSEESLALSQRWSKLASSSVAYPSELGGETRTWGFIYPPPYRRLISSHGTGARNFLAGRRVVRPTFNNSSSLFLLDSSSTWSTMLGTYMAQCESLISQSYALTTYIFCA